MRPSTLAANGFAQQEVYGQRPTSAAAVLIATILIVIPLNRKEAVQAGA